MQTAMETFYTDEQTYAGADGGRRPSIEPAIGAGKSPRPVGRSPARPSTATRSPSRRPKTGNVFIITKAADGSVTRTCTADRQQGLPEHRQVVSSVTLTQRFSEAGPPGPASSLSARLRTSRPPTLKSRPARCRTADQDVPTLASNLRRAPVRLHAHRGARRLVRPDGRRDSSCRAAQRAPTARRPRHGRRDTATNLASELIEGARSVPYEKVSSPGVTAELQALPGLEDIDGGAYTIRRNGTTYSVAVDVCIMDDPKDGGGPRADHRDVLLQQRAGRHRRQEPRGLQARHGHRQLDGAGRARACRQQTGLINNPGSASGPADPLDHAARLHRAVRGHDRRQHGHRSTSRTSSKPTTIGWLLDGTRQTSAVTPERLHRARSGSSTGTSRRSTTAPTSSRPRPTTSTASPGPGRQETVVLNRFPPARAQAGHRRPHQVRHGRDRVDGQHRARRRRLPGLPRRGRDAGLRHRRPRSSSTFCIDTAPAGPTPRSSTTSAPTTRTRAATSARAPTRPTCSSRRTTRRRIRHRPHAARRSPSGDTQADVERAPSPEDPDAGDSVSFFRIYRDGIALGNRYERYFDASGSPTVTWTDTGTERHRAHLLGHRGRPAVRRVAVRRAGDRDEPAPRRGRLHRDRARGRRRDLARRSSGRR